MTVSRLWEEYQFLTEKVTEHARKLGFAGVLTCWLFKDDNFTFPPDIYFSLLGFIVYFILDLSHYLVGAFMIKRFAEQQESELRKVGKNVDHKIEKPRSVDRPAFILFVLKIIVLVAAFTAIGVELVNKLGWLS
jgi:hypothetical protein